MAANQNLVEQITLSVESTKDVRFSADEAQIINAVSPKVNIRRMEDGAVITVTDVDGVHDPVTIYDGAKGEKGDAGGVQYDSAQTLNATQKQTARTNIGAASEKDVTDIKSVLNNTYSLADLTWVIGTLLPSSGAESTSTMRIRSPFVRVSGGDRIVVSGNSNCLIVYCFSDKQEYLSDSSWTDGNIFTVPNKVSSTKVGYVRIVIRKSSSNATITSEEVATQKERCFIRKAIQPSVYDFDDINADNQRIFNDISENYNLYKKYAIYSITNSEGVSKTGYTVNGDGTISCVRYISLGSFYLVDKSRTLPIGTYTISAKITLTAPSPTSNQIVLCVGRTPAYKVARMTTERGGDTNIETGVKEGYVRATFTVSAEEDFAFECIAGSSTMADGDYPMLISELMISEGENLLEYNSINYSAVDIFANTEIEKLKSKSKVDVLLPSGDTLVWKTNGFEIGGESSFVYICFDQSKKQINFTDIVTQVGNTYASITDGSLVITLPSEGALCFDISTNKFVMRTNVGNLTDSQVVLAWRYYQKVGGRLFDYAIPFNNFGQYLLPQSIFNGEPFSGTYDFDTPTTAYGALFKGTTKVESFAFFTDPHVMGFGDATRNTTRMQNYFKRVQAVYRATPCSFLACGGDALNTATTMDEACYRLGLLKGIFRNMLDDCKLVMGNHDTNYQGKLDSESENYTGRLTDATLASILFRDTDTKKAYYSFDGSNSKCYVLDTGIEHSSMLAYDWEQVDWLANKLLEDDAEHAIIFLHIIVNQGSIQTNASNFGTLVQAYNGHTSVTLNGVTYNFSACSGHVDFWVAGHTHEDSTGTLGGIPYMITGSNSHNSDVPLIDLVLVDYDNDIVKTIRVGGTGEDRTISI